MDLGVNKDGICHGPGVVLTGEGGSMPSNRVQPWLPCKTDSPCSEEPTRLQVYPCSYHAHQRAAHKRSAAQGAALFQFEQSARQQLANEAPRILGGLEARARHKVTVYCCACRKRPAPGLASGLTCLLVLLLLCMHKAARGIILQVQPHLADLPFSCWCDADCSSSCFLTSHGKRRQATTWNSYVKQYSMSHANSTCTDQVRHQPFLLWLLCGCLSAVACVRSVNKHLFVQFATCSSYGCCCSCCAACSPAMESPNTECSSGATSSAVSASAAAHVTTASNQPPDVCRTPLAVAEARHSSARGRIARPQEQQQQQRQAHTMSVSPSHINMQCACNSTLGQKADSSSRGCPAGHSSAGRFGSSNSRAAQDGWSWYRGPGPPGETLQEPLLLWNTEASIQPAAKCAPALGQDSVKGRQLHDAGLEKQQDAQLFDGPLTGQCLSPLSCTGRTAAELSEPRRQTSADWPQADVSRSELPQLGSNCRNSRSPDWGKRHSKSGRSSSKSRTSPVAQVLSSCHAAAVLALDKSSCNARADSLREPLLLDQS